MRPSFLPRTLNDPFGDPGLFVPFRFEKRALLFDLGDLSRLSSRDLLKVSHGFVTHTHMDHFIGFDSLLRVFLGRDKILHLYGPPNFIQHVEGKLKGYTWNLVSEYENEFEIFAHEVHRDRILTRRYRCRERFDVTSRKRSQGFSGILLEEPSFLVRGALLDHRTPSLALSLTEHFYVNIMKDRLEELGLPVGPWLSRFKAAIYAGADPKSDFEVSWQEKPGVTRSQVFPMGHLVDKLVTISPGQKITYITDVAATPENYRKITDFAGGSDLLFIEAAFMDRDRDLARKKYHLTAREAGELARASGVKNLEVFHFSPRYSREEAEELEQEAREAFEGR